jgi:hypothetical protein
MFSQGFVDVIVRSIKKSYGAISTDVENPVEKRNTNCLSLVLGPIRPEWRLTTLVLPLRNPRELRMPSVF